MFIIDEAERLVFNIGGDIKHYFSLYTLENIYLYNFTISDQTLFTFDEMNKINGLKNGFEKNKLLKDILFQKIMNSENKLQYYNWIVKQWGGIRHFDKSKEEIDDFFENITNKRLYVRHFGTISSYSKLISFKNPSEYFIFDSKVAYVLNWLLLKNYKKENKYFIIPPGRNSDLVKYNMDTIINLYDKNNIKHYYEKKHTYFIYCEFIKRLFKNIKNGNIEKPYYIEMMLFGLFENISNEIKNRVRIIIE